MNIHLYTLCWNEIDILSFVLDYWKRLPITKAVVYDNGSTDGSIEYLQQYEWIEVRHFETEGQNDNVQRDIKSKAWKESKGKCDFVIVCDMDEMIYCPTIEQELQYMKDNGYNVMGMPWYALCYDDRPEYDPNKLLHQQGHKFYKQYINHKHIYSHLGKFMLFDPNLINDMGYSVGCHISNPTPQIKLYETNKAFSVHINKGFSEDYFVARRKIMSKNLSQVNRKANMCYEYNKNEEEQRKEYRKYQSEAVDVNKLFLF